MDKEQANKNTKTNNNAGNFNTFLKSIEENAPLEIAKSLGEGCIYLAHKSVFQNIKIENVHPMQLSLINDRGIVLFKFVTPGTVIPQLPVHAEKDLNNNGEYLLSIRRFSQWAIILQGGEHFSNYKEYEKYLNYQNESDDDLLSMTTEIHQKARNNDFRSTCYGHCEVTNTDPNTMNKMTICKIFEHAFPYISNEERKDYVMFINGTHLLYTSYALYYLESEDERSEKNKVIMNDKTFTVKVDNFNLVENDCSKQMYLCPLILGTCNVLNHEKVSNEKIFKDRINKPDVEEFNATFTKYYRFKIEDKHTFPIDPFIFSMLSTLVMNEYATPFCMKEDSLNCPEDHFKSRLQFIYSIVSGKDIRDLENSPDQQAAALCGTAVMHQISQSAFWAFRKPILKAEFECLFNRTDTAPENFSSIVSNQREHLNYYESKYTEEEIMESLLEISLDSSMQDFFIIAERSHIYNVELFQSKIEMNDGGKKISSLKEKPLCEYLKTIDRHISHGELLFLKQNSNIFLYKLNICFLSHFILKNVELPKKVKKEENIECPTCKKKIYRDAEPIIKKQKTTDILENGRFCPCIYFYAAVCYMSTTCMQSSISIDMCLQKMKSYDKILNRDIPKDNTYVTYKIHKTLPVNNNAGTLGNSGGLRLSHRNEKKHFTYLKGSKGNKRSTTTTANNNNNTNSNNNNGSVNEKDESPEKLRFLRSVPFNLLGRKINEALDPIFGNRYTIYPQTKSLQAIISAHKHYPIEGEDIDIQRLLLDELIKMSNLKIFFKSDGEIPSISSIPVITVNETLLELKKIYEEEEELDDKEEEEQWMDHEDKEEEEEKDVNDDSAKTLAIDSVYSQTSLKSTTQNAHKTLKRLFNSRCLETEIEENKDDEDENVDVYFPSKKKKKMSCNDDDIDSFIKSSFYTCLINGFTQNEDSDSKMKDIESINEYLKKVATQSKDLSSRLEKIGDELITNAITTYIKLLGKTLKNVYKTVETHLELTEKGLDNEFEDVEVYSKDNAQKTRSDVTSIYDLYAPNRIVSRNILHSYYGHLKQMSDLKALQSLTVDLQQSSSRLHYLEDEHGLQTQQGTIMVAPSIFEVEENTENKKLPPLLKLKYSKNVPTFKFTFITPGLGKVLADSTVYKFDANDKNEANPSSYNDYSENDLLECYYPIALIKKENGARKAYPTNRKNLVKNLRHYGVRFSDLGSEDFMYKEYHDICIQRVNEYLSDIDCNATSFGKTPKTKPPMIYILLNDIRRILMKINTLLEFPQQMLKIINSGPESKNEIQTKGYLPKFKLINNEVIISKIATAMKKDSQIAAIVHLYCHLSQLYGTDVSVSGSKTYDICQERRPELIRTFQYGVLRVSLQSKNGDKQLHSKAFRTLLTDFKLEKGKFSKKITVTMNDVNPRHAYYLTAPMNYIAYEKQITSNANNTSAEQPFRRCQMSGQFFFDSIFASAFNVQNCYSSSQATMCCQVLFKNYSDEKPQKSDIDTQISSLNMMELMTWIEEGSITLTDLLLYYENKCLIPDEITEESKSEMLQKCINLHGDSEEDEEGALFEQDIFEPIWNLIIEKYSCLSNEEEDSS